MKRLPACTAEHRAAASAALEGWLGRTWSDKGEATACLVETVAAAICLAEAETVLTSLRRRAEAEGRRVERRAVVNWLLHVHDDEGPRDLCWAADQIERGRHLACHATLTSVQSHATRQAS